MYETILFDLDGTLTDPKIGITLSVQYALERMGIHEEDADKLIPFIGPPLLESFMDYYHMSREEAALAITYYRERFSTIGLYENVAYPGIRELLIQLKAQGKKLIVATSKPTDFSVQILEHFALKEFFDVIIGSNLDGTRTHKSDVIEFALESCSERDKVVMIGDRKYDIIGAKQNGIDVIGVAYGYGSYEELADAKPQYIVSSVEELANLLLKN